MMISMDIKVNAGTSHTDLPGVADYYYDQLFGSTELVRGFTQRVGVTSILSDCKQRTCKIWENYRYCVPL